jgi:predicted SnoaL-like aldol condensation-catalyzing enzyme
MTTYRALIALVAVCAVVPAIAQEPIVPAADPEALFTDPDPKLHANKQAALHVLRELIQCGWWHRASEWITDRYLQHNPNASSGRDTVIDKYDLLSRPRAATCDRLTMPVVTVLTSGDIVGVVMKYEYDNPRVPGTKYYTIFYDQWRIVDGRADEHWDTALIDGPRARVARD